MSSDSDHNSSDDDFQMHTHLFKSSLDVGSHFIDIEPENELVFYNQQGVLLSQLTIKNVSSKAHVAFFVLPYLPLPPPLGFHLGPLQDHHQPQVRLHPTQLPASHLHRLARQPCKLKFCVIYV